VNRALVSVAVGLAGAAAVTTSGWALQAGALPPPTPAAHVAADATAWLHEHRLVVDVFHVDHRRSRGACVRGWFGLAHGRKVQGSLLSMEGGSIVRASTGRHMRISIVRGRPSRFLPARLAAIVGCSGELGAVIDAAAQGGGDLEVARAFAANRPAIALKLADKHRRLTLYLSPRTYQPRVAELTIGGEHVTARLYLASVTRPLLAQFDLLRAAEPRIRR
jgi:hypothetical protein